MLHYRRRPLLVTLAAALLSSVRATLVRVLILITSMGYGVVMPYLGAMQKKVILGAAQKDSTPDRLANSSSPRCLLLWLV